MGVWLEKKGDKMSQSLPNEMCNYFIRVKDRAKIIQQMEEQIVALPIHTIWLGLIQGHCRDYNQCHSWFWRRTGVEGIIAERAWL